MKDYSGLAPALLDGAGIGELPPVVRPELKGQLVEIMPDWRFLTFDLSLAHLGFRHISKPSRLFKELATPDGADPHPACQLEAAVGAADRPPAAFSRTFSF